MAAGVSMSPAVIALAFALIGACAVHGLRMDLATGVARDGIYAFRQKKNPLGYGMVLTGKLAVLVLCLGEVLHAMRLCGDPMLLLNHLFG
jgi:hypothetical protein